MQPHQPSFLPSHMVDDKEIADGLFFAQISKLFPSHPPWKLLEKVQRGGQAV